MTLRQCLAFTSVSYVGLRIVPTVEMTLDNVVISAPRDEVADWFRDRMNDGPDVLAAGPDRLVRRFRGLAGLFRYETVELVTLGRDVVTFEHLAGPFARCHESFSFASVGDGSTEVAHAGNFGLRGGLWTWPMARTAVKLAFERHVHEHLIAMRDEFAATPNQS